VVYEGGVQKKAFEISRMLKHPIDKFHYELMGENMEENGNVLAIPIIDISSR